LGKGYATEAARWRWLRLRALGLAEIVSFTAATNLRSRAVMERLGMQRNPMDDFDHRRCTKAIRSDGMCVRLRSPP
jgi:ribosomal-protein-alanine N-acetyltransferase